MILGVKSNGEFVSKIGGWIHPQPVTYRRAEGKIDSTNPTEKKKRGATLTSTTTVNGWFALCFSTRNGSRQISSFHEKQNLRLFQHTSGTRP